MNNYEISGNLIGIENYKLFEYWITKTRNVFIQIFGEEIMSKIDLFIDNATAMSGHTPIITVILKKCLTIKLNIDDFKNEEIIVYQFSHELCHYVFYALMGLEKEFADVEEENICSAMSLIMIKLFFPEDIDIFIKYVSELSDENYNKGTIIAEQHNFDANKLKQTIYDVCKYKVPMKV